MVAGTTAAVSMTTSKAQRLTSQQYVEPIVAPIEITETISFPAPENALGEEQGNVSAEGTENNLRDAQARHAEDWQSWPIIPELSETALEVYQRGLKAGRNPHAFSKIGDGEISAAWFLTDFDIGPDYYNLGQHSELQNTILYFSGSFGRQSQSAKRGFKTQSVLDPSKADLTICQTGETPVGCEIRLHNPAFALISMGTNQVWQPEMFEQGMRQIIETLLENDVVPILSTKADNLEGDHHINFIIARLSVEYDLPVWNFWRAVQPLPNHGLQDDLEHLTYYPNIFSAPEAMQFAWPVRNLSALQVLDALPKVIQP
jgi:hypothetical protein